MKRLILIVALLVGCAYAQTTTVTGTIKDLTGANVTSGKVTFTLRPSRDTTISGLARFSPQTVTCVITGAGLIKALDGASTCTITSNTSLQPPGSYYVVGVWPYNVKTSTFTFYAVNANYDWSTVVPTPTTSPAQNFVDIFSNQTIGGNKVWSGSHTFNGAVGFPGGITGPISLQSLNNIQYADQFPGADASIKIIACVTSLIALGGGICDARGLYGSQTISQEVDVGNHAQVPIALLLPQYAIWTVTINNASAYGFKLFGGSSIIGYGMNNVPGNTMFIRLASTASVFTVVGTEINPTGGGSYVHAEGFAIYGPDGGVVADSALFTNQLYDASVFRNINVAYYGAASGSGVGWHVTGACCSVTFDRITAASNHGAGGTYTNAVPMLINQDHGTTIGTNFTNLSVDHPSAGKNNMVIVGGTTLQRAMSLNFVGLYMEGSLTNTVTPMIASTGGQRLSFKNVTASRLAPASTAYVFDVTNASFFTAFDLEGFNFYNDNGTNAYNSTGGEVVNDHIRGLTVHGDANGLLPCYFSGIVCTNAGKFTIYGGITPDGGGFKHKRATGCTTGATAGNNCETTVTWTTAFPDANYTASCTLLGTATLGHLAAITTSAIAAASVKVQTVTDTNAAITGTVNCIAVHD